MNEKVFLSSLVTHIHLSKLYEAPTLKQKALNLIPKLKLVEKSENAYKSYLKQQSLINLSDTEKDTLPKLDANDFLAVVAMQWFNQDFFQWFDAPDCNKCGERSRAIGQINLPPNHIYVRDGNATRLELYACKDCMPMVELNFPRYNDPGKLLESRKGRCGEWANCFCLIMRALNFETRYVLDWTDHVWVEFYSNSQGRWIHADPCECVCDKPLMYEVGWSKSLNYVIAFSNEEVVDVSWRYSSHHMNLLAKRKQVSETWLLNTLKGINTKLRQSIIPARAMELDRRLIVELVEFMSPKENLDPANYQGRVSGDAAWRASRHEQGGSEGSEKQSTSAKSETSPFALVFKVLEDLSESSFNRVPPYVFELNVKETDDINADAASINVAYDCNTDAYNIIYKGCGTDREDSRPNWSSCAYQYSNVWRKVERDWKKCYLCCTEHCGSTSPHPEVRGEIAWKFAAGPPLQVKDEGKLADGHGPATGWVIQRFQLNIAGTQTYGNASVRWKLLVRKKDTDIVQQLDLNKDGTLSIDTEEYEGADNIIIKAELLGDSARGTVAWQSVQILRQDLKPSAKTSDFQNSPFKVQVTFKKEQQN